jgi:hypothetical protein
MLITRISDSGLYLSFPSGASLSPAVPFDDSNIVVQASAVSFGCFKDDALLHARD